MRPIILYSNAQIREKIYQLNAELERVEAERNRIYKREAEIRDRLQILQNQLHKQEE